MLNLFAILVGRIIILSRPRPMEFHSSVCW